MRSLRQLSLLWYPPGCDGAHICLWQARQTGTDSPTRARVPPVSHCRWPSPFSKGLSAGCPTFRGFRDFGCRDCQTQCSVPSSVALHSEATFGFPPASAFTCRIGPVR